MIESSSYCLNFVVKEVSKALRQFRCIWRVGEYGLIVFVHNFVDSAPEFLGILVIFLDEISRARSRRRLVCLAMRMSRFNHSQCGLGDVIVFRGACLSTSLVRT